MWTPEDILRAKKRRMGLPSEDESEAESEDSRSDSSSDSSSEDSSDDSSVSGVHSPEFSVKREEEEEMPLVGRRPNPVSAVSSSIDDELLQPPSFQSYSPTSPSYDPHDGGWNDEPQFPDDTMRDDDESDDAGASIVPPLSDSHSLAAAQSSPLQRAHQSASAGAVVAPASLAASADASEVSSSVAGKRQSDSAADSSPRADAAEASGSAAAAAPSLASPSHASKKQRLDAPAPLSSLERASPIQIDSNSEDNQQESGARVAPAAAAVSSEERDAEPPAIAETASSEGQL